MLGPVGGWWCSGLAGGCLAGEVLRDFEEPHAGFEEGRLQEMVFGFGEIALGFLSEEGEHVHGLTGAEEVNLGLLARFAGSTELHDGLHVNGLDETRDGGGRDGLHAGILGADGGVEAVYGGIVSAGGLGDLVGCGGRWELFFRCVGSLVRLGVRDWLRGPWVGRARRRRTLQARVRGGGRGTEGWCVGTGIAFCGEFAAVVDYEGFVGHFGFLNSVLMPGEASAKATALTQRSRR